LDLINHCAGFNNLQNDVLVAADPELSAEAISGNQNSPEHHTSRKKTRIGAG
jgi:hypothetical protein